MAVLWGNLATAIAWIAAVVGGIGSLLVAFVTYSGLPADRRREIKQWWSNLRKRSIKAPPKGAATVVVVAISASMMFGIGFAAATVRWVSSHADSHKAHNITVLAMISLNASESQPRGIAEGPDHAIWFVERSGNKIGRVTLTRQLVQYEVPTRDSGLDNIAVGPDGNLWFTEGRADQIGRITLAGKIAEFALPTQASDPAGIVAGPDGNLWITEYHGARVAVMTPAGRLTREISLQPGSQPDGITVGPDHNIWFAESQGDRQTGIADIGRIIPTNGQVDLIAVPTHRSRPNQIVVGPDHNLWFTEQDRGRIGRLSPTMTGGVTEFRTSSQDTGPRGIVVGPDGNIWFVESNVGKLGRIVPRTGQVSEYLMAASIRPLHLVEGGDGDLWVTESAHGKIWQVAIENT